MKAVDLPKAAVIITSILAVGFTLVFWANSPKRPLHRIDYAAVEQAANNRHQCRLNALSDQSKVATARLNTALVLQTRNELDLLQHLSNYTMVGDVYCKN